MVAVGRYTLKNRVPVNGPEVPQRVFWATSGRLSERWAHLVFEDQGDEGSVKLGVHLQESPALQGPRQPFVQVINCHPK